MRRNFCKIVIATVLTGFVGTAGATSVWQESVDGDLSGDPGAPSVLVFGLGSNKVTGSLTPSDDARDYITFSIAQGQVLASINLVYFIEVGFPNDASEAFHAINGGTTSFIPGNDTNDSFLGGDQLGAFPSGTDLLQMLASAPITGTGFMAPLPEGSYSYLLQQTGSRTTGYSLDFVVANIPLPPAVWLLGSALVGLAGLRQKKHCRQQDCMHALAAPAIRVAVPDGA